VYLLWKPLPNPTYALILHRNGQLLSICTNFMPSNTYTGTKENIFPHITVLSSLWTRMFQPPSTCTTMGNEESIFCCMWVCFSTHTHTHTYICIFICRSYDTSKPVLIFVVYLDNHFQSQRLSDDHPGCYEMEEIFQGVVEVHSL
jgi:hypothetical protein